MRHRTRTTREPGRARILAPAWLAALLFLPGLAFATLGQDATTIEKDRVQFQARRAVTQAAGYTVHELTMSGGAHVREYLDSAQRVFAVSWSGGGIPDLQQLLGSSYFPRYRSAAQAAGRSRRGVAVDESDLVIHTGGHFRAFFGVAYLPARMPPGVTPEQIR
jgi:hypothetical protein